MIPLYWINLDRSVDRRNQFISQCKKYGLINRRIPAVVHEKPHIGCCLSHIKAIHTAFIEGHEMAIICEDDTDLTQGLDIYKKVDTILNSLPVNDWDILQLQYTEPTFQKCILEYRQKDKLDNYILKGYFMGTVAYLINRKGMERFLNIMILSDPSDLSNYVVNVSLDDPRAKCEELVYRYVNTYVTMIPVINYVDGQSTIESFTTYVDNNTNNCRLTQEIHKLVNVEQYRIAGYYELDYHLHWFHSNREFAGDYLKKIVTKGL